MKIPAHRGLLHILHVGYIRVKFVQSYVLYHPIIRDINLHGTFGLLMHAEDRKVCLVEFYLIRLIAKLLKLVSVVSFLLFAFFFGS